MLHSCELFARSQKKQRNVYRSVCRSLLVLSLASTWILCVCVCVCVCPPVCLSTSVHICLHSEPVNDVNKRNGKPSTATTFSTPCRLLALTITSSHYESSYKITERQAATIHISSVFHSPHSIRFLQFMRGERGSNPSQMGLGDDMEDVVDEHSTMSGGADTPSGQAFPTGQLTDYLLIATDCTH